MPPKLDDKLNLVIPIERDGGTLYIHSTPISREVFEGSFRLLAATHSDLFGRGGAYATIAPRVATLTLRDIGKGEAARLGDEEGDGGVKALLEEIKRLTVVIGPSPQGWKTLPIDAAIAQGLLSDDEWREAESATVFFTCIWWMKPARERVSASSIMASAIGLVTTSSSPSEWMSSLPSSTPPAPSAQPAVAGPGPALAADGKTPLSSIPS